MTFRSKIKNLSHKIFLVGGGFLAYGISAMQTTILSIHIAHYCSQKYLAVFSFLLSCLYFSVQLLRRNILEPFYQSDLVSININYKIQIAGVMSFMFIVSSITAYISELFKLSLYLMLLTFSTLFWEIRKAVLRKAKLIMRYSILEALILTVLSFIILGNLIGYSIDPESTILLLLIMHILSIFMTKRSTITILEISKMPKSASSVRSYSFSEYLFVVSIIVSNLWLMFAGYVDEIGEIRAVFLLLTLSTFSIGALRNSLATEMSSSVINSLLLGAVLFNIVIVYFLPASFIQRIIPSVSDDFRSLLVPISLDLIGSLTFMIFSLKLVRNKNMIISSESRCISVIFLVLFFTFIDRENLDSLSIAYAYGLSSISGAIYLYLRKSKDTFFK
jgi:hypothetical protein